MIWSKVSFSILRFTFNFQNKLDLVRVNYFKKYTYHHQFIMEQSQTSSPEPKTPKIEHENSQEIVQNIIQDVVHQIVPSHQLGNLLKQRNLWILWFINIFLWTFAAFSFVKLKNIERNLIDLKSIEKIRQNRLSSLKS